MESSMQNLFYSYLNLESTKTIKGLEDLQSRFYSYLNLESTKTQCENLMDRLRFIVT